LALANLIGIPFDGASVNPARSFGPAVVVGGAALSQLWLFLLPPLVGAVFAAVLHFAVYPPPEGFALPGLQRHRGAQQTAAVDEKPGGPDAVMPGPEEAQGHAQPHRTDAAGADEHEGTS
jgi:aquaporin Z